MKKILAILACAALLTAALLCAAAEEEGPSRTPMGQREGISLEIEDEALFLDFDDSPEYTVIEDGYVQASFYVYGADGDSLFELYMTFPETVQAGDEVSPGYAATHGAEDCSVALIYSTTEEEDYYLAGQLGREVYPVGSDYAISFDAVEKGDDGFLFSGSLTATLVYIDLDTGVTGESIDLTGASFSFTLPVAEADPALPRETPKVTLPPDMYKV